MVPPRGVNFTAFESRFQMICWKRRVAEDARDSWRDAHEDLDPLGGRGGVHGRHGACSTGTTSTGRMEGLFPPVIRRRRARRR